ncbi:glycoside hydrolase family 127 protein [Paenibacillus sp. PL91]|uniref:glycoside hydrolase family 127 protein n=1 Tax=Paenibacillus sp. PL91 TaxID=2729538 RepID=UPI00145F7E21|nr:beta-L-arabinofuranosidase domain-containing protein [Paenibacillus sp. PL91]MBC9203719.1 glycoside hydrolase family 127 protein [Paenibacillus sp. PL91]
MEKLKNLSYKAVQIDDPFWTKYMHLVRDEVIPYQWDALNDRIEEAAPSHAIQNFRIAAGEAEGDFYGYIFQDSDVAKWLEAVAYSLASFPNSELEKLADLTIDLLGRAQQSDGYLNTHFTIKYPDQRWLNERDNHETYCAGHLIEAAVAYYETTGKIKLLDIACKLADHIDSIYGEGEGKLLGYPGHQEIELALMRLYEATGVERYLKLSHFFINERGQEPHYFKLEAEKRAERFGRESLLKEGYYNLYKNNYEYNQSHLPVREQLHATGHAVRAVYMYAGMVDVAAATQDQSLIDACKRLWDNVTQRQMYITGGIGSNHDGEAFSFDYDLPNDTAYTETCAAIGLVFWAHRMLHLDPDGKYADVIERALYNGTISGMSLDGKSFFYVNPLEVWPDACKRPDKMHVEPVRKKWFGCACCPPNIARLIASLGQYIYSQSEQTVYVHQFIGSETKLVVAGRSVLLSQQTNFPWDETIELSVNPDQPGEFTVAVRIPGWCESASVHVNGQAVLVEAVLHKGYAAIKREWKAGDVVRIVLPMPIERIYANPNVRVNAGKVALQRGPVVYCLEQADNGTILPDISLPEHASLDAQFEPGFLGGVTVITGEALRGELSGWDATLYAAKKRSERSFTIKAIPYFAWANRGAGEMQVWIREH